MTEKDTKDLIEFCQWQIKFLNDQKTQFEFDLNFQYTVDEEWDKHMIEVYKKAIKEYERRINTLRTTLQ